MCKATGNAGSAIGLGVVALLRQVLTNHQLITWGWRIPFLISILFGVVGIKLRANLQDEVSSTSLLKTTYDSKYINSKSEADKYERCK